MKTLLSLGLALLALTPARAQLFGPQTMNGVLLGGIAGAVIGHNSGSLSHNGWQGAAIGAAAGGLLGAAADASNARYQAETAVAPGGYYVYRNGYGTAYSGGYGYSSGYGYGYSGSAATDGLLLGALAGGIIGNNRGFNHGRNGWVGAAWGAGAGWLLGSLIDANSGYYGSGYGYPSRSRGMVVSAAQPAATPAAAATPPATFVNPTVYSNPSPMAAANSLFGR